MAGARLQGRALGGLGRCDRMMGCSRGAACSSNRTRRQKPFMLCSRFVRHAHATHAACVAKRLPFHPQRAFHASAVLRLLDMEKVNTSERLVELRKLMKEHQIDVYSMVI